MDAITTKACDLRWFADKAAAKIFDDIGYCAVYAVGPTTSDKAKIGQGMQLPARLVSIQNAHWAKLVVKAIQWTPGYLFAERLQRMVCELIECRRVRGDWFDIPTIMIDQSIAICARKAGIKLLSHEDMLASVLAERERRISLLAP
ncbi:MAG: hypothetical protein KDK08_05285 [Rhizobiaceae bacterium]|nr:hypothetical protein [Rhizobiaceae bacterium]MCC0000883.1 hypothetical protein [Methylobacteriaceae bacterium]